MRESRTFSLRLSTATKLMFPGILGMMTLAGVLIPVAGRAEANPNPLIFAGVWFAVLGFFWFQLLSIPQAIVLDANDVLEFRSILKSRSIALADLRRVEPVPNQFGFFRFVHTNGSLTILAQFDGFHELLATIKAQNPAVLLLGC